MSTDLHNLLDIGVSLAGVASKKVVKPTMNSITDKFMDLAVTKATSRIEAALLDNKEELWADVTSKLKNLSQDPEFKDSLNSVSREIFSGLIASFQSPEVRETLVLYNIMKTAGHTLFKGLTTSYVLRDARGIAVTCAFIFCDLVQLPVIVSSGIVLAFTKLAECVASQRSSALQVEGPNDTSVELVTETLVAIWQAICVALGFSESRPRNMKEFALSCFKGVSGQASKTKDLLLFFGNVLKVCARLYNWALAKAFGITNYSRLLYSDRQVMETWTAEATLLLRPENEKRVINDAAWFARLVAVSQVSDLFKRELNQAAVKNVPPFITQLDRRINMLHLKALHQGIATAYRPEPVCLWVAGPVGLGKSFMKDDMVISLLSAVETETTGNDIYTVNMSQKYWTGAEFKPVIYYDEFCPINDSTLNAEALGQFLQLISDARFAPPQAECADKDKVVAPVLVYVTSNDVTPNPQEVMHNDALLRRRHIVVEVERTKSFIDRFGAKASLETEGAMAWLSRFKSVENPTPHVQYYLADPMTGKRKTEALSYLDLKKRVTERFVARFNINRSKYLSKMENMRVLSDENCDQPLEGVLEEIRKRALAAAAPGVCEDSLRMIWDVSKTTLKEATAWAQTWVREVSGAPLVGESPTSCTCSPHFILSCTVQDGESGDVIVRLRGELAFEVEPAYCAAGLSCAQATMAWRSRVLDLGLANPAIREAARLYVSKLPPLECMKARAAPVRDLPPVDFEPLRRDVGEVKVPTKYKMIGIGLLSLALAIGCCKTIKWLMFKDNSSSQPPSTTSVRVSSQSRFEPRVAEVVSSGDNVTRRLPVSGGIRVKQFKSQGLDGQYIVESPNQFHEIIDKNMCYLVLNGEDTASGAPVVNFTMRCFGICGNWMLVLKHYVSKIERTKVSSLAFVNSSATVNQFFSISECERRDLAESEIVLVRVPPRIPLFRDIRKHMMTGAESAYLPSRAFVYERMLGELPVRSEVRVQIQKNLMYKDGDVDMEIPDALVYNWHGAGRCVTPLYAAFSRYKIVGFHIAGGAGGQGAAEPIVAETFLGLQGCLDVQMATAEHVGDCKPAVSIEADLYDEGVTLPKYSSRPAEKTSIVPSLIHGYVPPLTRPAPLKPADTGFKFSPLIEGVVKHGKPPKGFDPVLLDRAKQFLLEEYLTKCTPIRAEVGVLSLETSVLGIPGLDGYEAMELSTSEGFPYMATRPHGERNKRYLFNIQETPERRLLGLDPQLMSIIQAKERLREAGVVPFTVFTDCLKDARIANEKFSTPGKTRVFSISPADFTIQFRQYFLDLLAATKKHRFSMHHMVGINVHSLEWTKLARVLCAKGTKLLCGDYSNFGPGLDSEVVKAVGEVWAEWYAYHEARSGVSESEISRRRTIRHCMFEEMRHSVHQCVNVLYRAPCGSPSGAPCTVNINNDVNIIYVLMGWLSCFKDNPIMCTPVSFKKHVELFVYGDDLIASVSDAVIDRFNNEYLAEFFGRHGIRYTDDTKSGTIRKWCSLMEASFLKNKFIPSLDHPGFFTAGLSKVSVEDCANWMHKSPDDQDATRQAICDSLMLSFGHGREYFDSHRARLLEAWREVSQEDLTLYTYEEMDLMRFGVCGEETSDIDVLITKEKELRERLKREADTSEDLTNLMVEALEDEYDFSDPRVKKVFRQLIRKVRALKPSLRPKSLENICREAEDLLEM